MEVALAVAEGAVTIPTEDVGIPPLPFTVVKNTATINNKASNIARDDDDDEIYASFASQALTINVGGQLISTSVRTLTTGRAAGSKLCKCFSNLDALPRQADGSVFIDRNPDAFGQILLWLISGTVREDPTLHDAMLMEAKYWRVSLIKYLL